MEHLPAGPGGHVIVHGLEGLGLRVVEHLVALGLEVVAVDDGARPGAVQAATALGADVVPHHDGAAAALSAAGLRDCRAVVCLSATDLGALETALLARRLRPELTVVAQIRNPAVARAVRADADVLVLDVATIASPRSSRRAWASRGTGCAWPTRSCRCARWLRRATDSCGTCSASRWCRCASSRPARPTRSCARGATCRSSSATRSRCWGPPRTGATSSSRRPRSPGTLRPPVGHPGRARGCGAGVRPWLGPRTCGCAGHWPRWSCSAWCRWGSCCSATRSPTAPG
ncbi:NAD-binding protein [Cellulomonas soli]